MPSGCVSCSYDHLNWLEMVTDLATGTTRYSYDTVGNLKTVSYPNGTVATYEYDLLNRLTLLENRGSDGSIISSYTYTLDAAGNRTKVEEFSGRVVDYAYDDTDKLLEERITNQDGSTSVISYTYDKVGNRLTKTEDGVTTTYMYDANNRLIQEDDIVYRYDDNGNLTEKIGVDEQVHYAYDAENHLIRAETTRFGVTIVVEYAYDARGNRVKKSIDGLAVTTYLVDENRDYAQVLEERDGDGNLLVRYVYGHDLISQTRDGVTSFYHYDGLGSTRALTSSAGIVTDEYTYDAFGNLLDKSGVTLNTHLYTGEFFDSHLGFYYLRARYMNPAIGRFVTMDSFAGWNRDPYSLHKYLYAHANPVNMVDPSGHMSSYAEITVAGSIIGAMSGIYVYHVTHAPEERDALGYVTWGAGGATIGSLLAYGAWHAWLQPAILTTATATTSTAVFNAPRIFRTAKNILTNGKYFLDEVGMTKHMTGSLTGEKSQFLFRVDARKAVLDAAAYADEACLWVGSQATVFVTNGPVGVIGKTGELTNWITITTTKTGFVHGWPSTGP